MENGTRKRLVEKTSAVTRFGRFGAQLLALPMPRHMLMPRSLDTFERSTATQLRRSRV